MYGACDVRACNSYGAWNKIKIYFYPWLSKKSIHLQQFQFIQPFIVKCAKLISLVFPVPNSPGKARAVFKLCLGVRSIPKKKNRLYNLCPTLFQPNIGIQHVFQRQRSRFRQYGIASYGMVHLFTVKFDGNSRSSAIVQTISTIRHSAQQYGNSAPISAKRNPLSAQCRQFQWIYGSISAKQQSSAKLIQFRRQQKQFRQFSCNLGSAKEGWGKHIKPISHPPDLSRLARDRFLIS